MIALYPYNDEPSVAVLTSAHEVYKVTVEETEEDDLTTTCSDITAVSPSSLPSDFSHRANAHCPLHLKGVRDSHPLALDDSVRLPIAQCVPLLLLPPSASGEQLFASTTQPGNRPDRLPAEHSSSAS